MNWISTNWEKAVLLLVSLIVILLGAMFVKRALSFNESFVFPDVKPDPTLPDTESSRVNQAKAVVDQVAPWKTPIRGGAAAKEVPLFVSVPIVEVEGKVIDILDPTAPKIRPPVSNQWLRDNGLDFKRSSILDEDQDRDSFTNLEEWEAKTSPVDAAAHPPYGMKLTMVARRQQSYVVEFVGAPDGNSFQINRQPSSSYKRDVFINGLGETTDDGKLKLESYEPLEAMSSAGIRVDASKLTVTYLETGEKFELVKGVKLTIPTYFLELAYELEPLDKKFYKIGEEIILPNDPDTQYKVVDIQENSATISYPDSSGSEKKIEISSQN